MEENQIEEPSIKQEVTSENDCENSMPGSIELGSNLGSGTEDDECQGELTLRDNRFTT